LESFPIFFQGPGSPPTTLLRGRFALCFRELPQASRASSLGPLWHGRLLPHREPPRFLPRSTLKAKFFQGRIPFIVIGVFWGRAGAFFRPPLFGIHFFGVQGWGPRGGGNFFLVNIHRSPAGAYRSLRGGAGGHYIPRGFLFDGAGRHFQGRKVD